jgi:filamentous hemagglutinin family protein
MRRTVSIARLSTPRIGFDQEPGLNMPKVGNFISPALLVAALSVAGLYPAIAEAQAATSITTDGTLGTTVNQAVNVFDINGGTLRGANQFHSFGNFTVGTGDVANFNGPAGTENIISRVTGGVLSEIDGTLASSIAGANLYLLNPAGVLMGPNAQLSVGGSFHASTADFLKLADDGVFFADPTGTSVLSAAPPSAFGFLGSPSGPIDVVTPNLLQVAPGETLSFVGGPVTFGLPDGSIPAYVASPGGRVNIVSVASQGEASFADGGIDMASFAELGDVTIQGNSVIDGQDVYIRGGDLVINNGVIVPGFFSIFGLGPSPDGGEVNIAVRNNVTLTGTANEPLLDTPPGILIFAGAFDAIAPPGKVPDVTVQAESVTISGAGAITANRVGPGDAGVVTIDTNTFTLENGGTVELINEFDGQGTALVINAVNVVLDGSGASDFTGLSTEANIHPAWLVSVGDPILTSADSGTITVSATENLVIRNGAQITTDSRSFGNSGDIVLTAADATIDNTIVAAQSGFAGDSGNITLNIGGQLEISNGAVVTAITLGSGGGGEVNLNVSGSVNVSGEASGVASQTQPLPDQELDTFAQRFGVPDFDSLLAFLGLPPEADIFNVLEALNFFGVTAVEDLAPGDGGSILITSPALTLSGLDAAIDSSTGWDGNAGTIQANLGTLTVSDGATIGSRSGLLTLDTGEVIVGSGSGGTIALTIDGTATITGQSSKAPSAISTSTLGDGNGGNISLAANIVNLDNGGTISASSSGNGLAGDIAINAGNRLDMSSDSRITTQATVSDGGNIGVTATERVYLNQAQITTSVESGLGGGGNIDIDPDFVVLNQSDILANAFGGPGGNITIVAGNFITTPDSTIDASSALGLDGTVNISSPDEEVAEDLAVLPANYLDVTGLISERCGTTVGASSLVDAGAGGLAIDPDGYLPSFALETNQEDETKGGSRTVSSGERWWALEMNQTALLPLALVTCAR